MRSTRSPPRAAVRAIPARPIDPRATNEETIVRERIVNLRSGEPRARDTKLLRPRCILRRRRVEVLCWDAEAYLSGKTRLDRRLSSDLVDPLQQGWPAAELASLHE